MGGSAVPYPGLPPFNTGQQPQPQPLATATTPAPATTATATPQQAPAPAAKAQAQSEEASPGPTGTDGRGDRQEIEKGSDAGGEAGNSADGGGDEGGGDALMRSLLMAGDENTATPTHGSRNGDGFAEQQTKPAPSGGTPRERRRSRRASLPPVQALTPRRAAKARAAADGLGLEMSGPDLAELWHEYSALDLDGNGTVLVSEVERFFAAQGPSERRRGSDAHADAHVRIARYR